MDITDQVGQLTKIMHEHMRNEGHSEAIKISNQIIKLIQKSADDNELAFYKSVRGLSYYKLGDYSTADRDLSSSMNLLNDDNPIKFTSFFYLGEIRKKWGQYKDSIRLLDDGFRLLQSLLEVGLQIPPHWIVYYYNTKGTVYLHLYDYDSALECFREAERNTTGFDDKGKGTAVYNIGNVYTSLGMFEDAKKKYDEAEEIAENVSDVEGVVSINLSRAGVHQILGEYREALLLLDKAASLVENIPQSQFHSRVYIQLSEHYMNRNRFETAKSMAKKGIDIAERLQLEHDILEGFILLAYSTYMLCLTRSNPDALGEAAEILEKARKIAIKLNLRIGSIHNIASLIILALGNIDQAISESGNSIDLIHEGFGKSIAIGNHAMLLSMANQFDDARKFAKIALEVSEHPREIQFRNQVYSILGYIEKKIGNLQESVEYFKNAIEHQERIFSNITSMQIRLEFRFHATGTYDQLVEALFDIYELDKSKTEFLFEALKYLELSKAREITDRLEINSNQMQSITDCPQYSDVVDAINKFHEVEVTLRQEYSFGHITYQGYKDAVEEKYGPIRELTLQVLERCPDTGFIKQPLNYDPIPRYRELFEIEPNIVIWEFFCPDGGFDSFDLIVWSKDNIDVYRKCPLDIKRVLRYTDEIHRLTGSEKYVSADNKLRELGRKLGNSIPKEVWSSLSSKALLVLIPHGDLHVLPWSVAQDENTDSKELGLLLPIVLNYSLSLMISCIKRETQLPFSALLISNPTQDLPHSTLEVNSIVELFTKNNIPDDAIILLEGMEAKKSMFLDALSKSPSLIHFSGHGRYHQNPLQSHLLFNSSSEKGEYTLTEIISNRFKGTPLFVLSACETAVSEIYMGDEAFGLIRGLLMAGSNSVVGTQWVVPDSNARIFISKFYEHLLDGKSVSESLFETRKSSMKNGSRSIYWNMFSIFGSPFKLIKFNQSLK